MVRALRWWVGLPVASAFVVTGCVSERVVRNGAISDAQRIISDAPTLMPSTETTSGATVRSQAPDPVVKQVSASNPDKGQVVAKIRASVNGIPILEDELREALAQYLGEIYNLPEQLRAEASRKLTERELDRLIERELVLEEAFAKLKEIKKPQIIKKLHEEGGKEADKRLRDLKTMMKVKSDDELKAALANQGISIPGLRRQIERSFMMMEYMNNFIYPAIQRINIQQIREYYEEHPDEFRVDDRIKWQDIFIDASRFSDPAAARKHAETIAAQAAAGADFTALVKQHDHGDSSLRNGAGIGEKPGEIKPPQAEPVLFQLKAGQVGPIIDMGFGLHVVKLVERQYAGLQPLDEKTQAKIRDKLRKIVAEREYKRIVEDLKRKATIMVYQ